MPNGTGAVLRLDTGFNLLPGGGKGMLLLQAVEDAEDGRKQTAAVIE